MGEQPQAWQAGDLRIDPEMQSVERAGQLIALPPLSFNVLLALVQAAPKFVSNDALMTQVWIGQIVSLETVTQRIKLLRDAIDDDPRKPRYIEGQRGRGYRFVAPVARLPPAPPPQSTAEGPRARVRKPEWIAASLSAALLLGVGGWLLTRSIDWRTLPPAADTEAGGALQMGMDHTIAVQRFEDLSGDESDAYLAVGLPEMILNRLSGTPGLTVIARSSSFAEQNKKDDARAVGARLHARYLIDGRVQRIGEALHVTVRLVETTGGTQLWAGQFDRSMDQLFALEDDIAAQVTGVLATRIRGLAKNPEPAERSGSIDAYLAYLQGRALLGRYGVADTAAAGPHFEHAIKLDATFAPAYAALYDARMQSGALLREDLGPLRARYQPLIDRALAIDPGCGSAYFAQAMWSGGNDSARKASFERGMRLDPSNGRGLTAYAEFLENDADEHDAAGRVLQKALWVDPMSPRAHFVSAIRLLDVAGPAVVEQRMLGVLELDPNFVPALQRYGKYRWELHGELAAGVQIIEHAIALDPGNPWLRHTAAAMYLDLDDPVAANDVAAGTPQSAVSARLLMALYRGDWRAAGLAARDPAGWAYSRYENWGAGEALRDYALRTGELQPGIDFLGEKYGLTTAPAKQLELDNFRQAVYYAQLLAAQGHAQEAVALRRAVTAWNDANQNRYGPLYARRTRATLLLLDGQQDAALDELAGSFQSRDYLNWWYTLRTDPIWIPLHALPRFQAIAAEVAHYVEQQRVLLAALRHDGAVPTRPEPGTHR
jgi:TolB-like protein/DNA-binding winged helix-turn-helix (wHTH) protein